MVNTYQGNEKQKTALKTYVKLIRAAETISNKMKTYISRFGLTESQFAVLEALYHLGPLCQKDIGKKILKSNGNVTMVVDHLVKSNYVKRLQNEEDRRYFNIILTSKGKNFLDNVIPNQFAKITNAMAVLQESEQIELQRLCKLLGTYDSEKN